ncbi:hypothetical protein GCM10010347_42530 [Streptomyces cirratus]|uniref:Uncharacterized protein n=1 Tax=Streptomyces cirratus TaxID=68187 RepID=A0ABQ3F2U9_9ACTN|nr:hypothetical protein [Streptomyces cirratus]GHB67906.1 hypothetical protein GCM10010347_42530 [Streptomyces cirratus]
MTNSSCGGAVLAHALVLPELVEEQQGAVGAAVLDALTGAGGLYARVFRLWRWAVPEPRFIPRSDAGTALHIAGRHPQSR